MQVTERKKGNICIVTVTGRLKFGSAVDRFERVVNELIERGERQFVFDMLEVPWMDTAGINATVAAHKHLRDLDQNAEIKLVLQGKSHELFVFYELNRVFDLHEDVESALAAFAVAA